MKTWDVLKKTNLYDKSMGMLTMGRRRKQVAVERKYKKFMQLFDQYFPHMPMPNIIFEVKRSSCYVKAQLFDTTIEIVKVKRGHYAAMHSIIETSEGFLKHLISSCVGSSSSEPTLGFSKSEKKEEVLASVSFLKEGRDGNSLSGCTENTNIPETSKEKTETQRNAEVFCKPFLNSPNGTLFSQIVHKHCTENRECFPEYLVEKQNGVFICKAEFLSESFTSKYAYSKEDAKEDVCKMIYKFIEERETNEASTPPLELAIEEHKPDITFKNRRDLEKVEEGSFLHSSSKKGRKKRTTEDMEKEKCGDAEKASKDRLRAETKPGFVTSRSQDDESPLFTEIKSDGWWKAALKGSSVVEKVSKELKGGLEVSFENQSFSMESLSENKTFGFREIFDSE